MKQFTQILITIMGLMVASTLAVLAETKAGNNFTGNQLMKGSAHWYEKAAVSVGAPDNSVKGKASLVLQAGSFLYLEGDSTLHKYQMNANVLLGSAVMKASKGDLAQALKSNGVSSMELVVPVNNLKSKEKGLDDNAYKALRAKEYSSIKFVLESETLKGNRLTGKGNLTIAGATVPITLSAETEIKGDQIHLKGVQKLKMTDYKITPPSISLLVTSITCSDEIDIHYDVTFIRDKEKK